MQEQLANPFVVGDELVGKRWSSWAFIRQFRLTDDLSIPLADIITLAGGWVCVRLYPHLEMRPVEEYLLAI